VAKELNVSLVGKGISTSHRLFNSGMHSGDQNLSKAGKNQHPPIIVLDSPIEIKETKSTANVRILRQKTRFPKPQTPIT